MYGLPRDFDSQVFVGRELQWVGVWSNQLMFNFDGECWIRLMSSYSLAERSERSGVRHYTVPHFEPRLMRIIDQRVRVATVEAFGTLRLSFENGDSLMLYDDPRYEAYALGWDGGDLMV